MFCPIIVNIGDKIGTDGRVRHRRNSAERAVRGIHVGIPNNSEGWLCYIPSTHSTVISTDVHFDEDFLSPHVRLPARTRFPGGIALQPHPQAITGGDQVEVTGLQLPLDQRGENDSDDSDSSSSDDSDSDTSSQNSDSSEDDDVEMIDTTESQPLYFDVEEAEGDWQGIDLEFATNKPLKQVSWKENIEEVKKYDPSKKSKSLLKPNESVRRSKRIAKQLQQIASQAQVSLPENPTPHQALFAEFAREVDWFADEMEQFDNIFRGFSAGIGETNIDDFLNDNVDDVSGMEADMFQPTPTHWKQILALPPHLKKHWKVSFKKELSIIIDKGTFRKEEKPDEEPVIPVTAKFRNKLKSDGSVDKLKSRICLRGDKQAELTDYDTWCPIGSFRELRKFLAFATSIKQRIYQLDFVGAFLQSPTQHVTYTILPMEWADLVPEYAEWLGIPLRLVKALYGDTTANKCLQ